MRSVGPSSRTLAAIISVRSWGRIFADAVLGYGCVGVVLVVVVGELSGYLSV